jgi:repressor LexA
MSQLIESLTERQKKIYEFIRDKIRNRGYGPTVREIGTQFGIVSPNGVMCHLRAIEKKGLIHREPNMSRAIQLAAEAIDDRSLPLAGQVAAGVLHEAIEQEERIDFDNMIRSKSPKSLFVLKVKGDSMIDAQIADGDYVVIRKAKTANNGQIVVAQTDDGEATLKRWFAEKNRIRLEPANSSMKPIFVKSAKILGVLAFVVRKTE